ncbi:response regulator transcription factor [Loigolactobacillus iwatensis]|uniref:response regulator transcription factor n=1 Tax=Loigolactobacillus iwatensis TaxID=1267156 RepID=UPI000F7E4069|nr:response regulator transcription factor [Loigolactobacillus iwatensis]
MIRIMIVDNHPVFREGLKAVFAGNSKFKIVAEAENGQLALQKLNTVAVDIMLLDIRMPVLDGISTLEHVKRQFPKVKVCILTTYDDVKVFNEAMALKADSFLLKYASSQTIFQTIQDTMNGQLIVSPDLLRNAVDSRSLEYSLSNEDLDILTKVAKGEHNFEIAQELHFSERTIKGYLTNIYNKLGVTSRAGAVAKAMQLELIRL